MNNSKKIYSPFDDILSFEDFLFNFPLPKYQNENKEKVVIEIPNNEDKVKDIINKNVKRIFQKKLNISSGRKKRREKSVLNQKLKKKSHDKFKADNIFIKVKANYQSFIPDFVNEILEALDFKEKFIKIDCDNIKKINKGNFSFIKSLSLSRILEQDISSKFRTLPKDKNRKILEKVIKNPIINKLLSESYLYIFQNIYYKNKRIINMKKYGKNINIMISKNVQMYEDLIEKNKDEPEYIQKLNKYVNKKYFNTRI